MIILAPTITMNLDRLDLVTDISLEQTHPDRVRNIAIFCIASRSVIKLFQYIYWDYHEIKHRLHKWVTIEHEFLIGRLTRYLKLLRNEKKNCRLVHDITRFFRS